MPFSTNLAAYTDVSPVLDAALKHKGGRYKLPTRAAAFKWRHRAYTYRKLLSQTLGGKQDYNQLELTIDDSTVVLTLRVVNGQFTTTTGEAVELEAASSPLAEDEEQSQLMDEAEKLVKDLGLQ